MNRGSKVQSVVLDDKQLLKFLSSLVGHDAPHVLMCPVGLQGLSRRFYLLLAKLRLGKTSYTLGSLRGGGAVEYFRRIQNLGALQYRGRWDNAGTLGHYLQEGLAALAYSKLDKETLQRIRTLADAWDSTRNTL